MIEEDQYIRLRKRLSGSPFRSRFHLSEKEKQYVYSRGLDEIRMQAEVIVAERLSEPVNDGKQTPMRGHAVFVAQHATATCCRKCMLKWHGIPPFGHLGQEETSYLVSVIMHFITDEMEGYSPEDYGQLMLFQ